MSVAIEIPSYLQAKSGEVVSERFLSWIGQTQKKLLAAFPAGERNFCRILDKLRSRMNRRWQTRLAYTRQKYFLVADHVVFFGDFYFPNMRLLVEIDGSSHVGRAAREADEWRSRLISTWRVTTARISNMELDGKDFRDIEKWFVEQAASVCPQSVRGRLLSDYRRVQEDNPHIYKADGIMTTRKRK